MFVVCVRVCLRATVFVCAVCEQWATWDGIRKFEAEKHDYLQGQIGLGPKLFVCACLVLVCALLCCWSTCMHVCTLAPR